MGATVSDGSQRTAATASFRLNRGTRVLRDDGTDVQPGTGEIGTVAITSSMIPLGYFKDTEKTARTFRTIGDRRYVWTGDMAKVELDGTTTLLGRGAHCINTGGEKVYPEEVEEAVKTHAAVRDCLVFGVEDQRFGESVVGVVAVVDTSQLVDPAQIIQYTRLRLAGYKVPRVLKIIPEIPRAANGKADYPAARRAFDGAPFDAPGAA